MSKHTISIKEISIIRIISRSIFIIVSIIIVKSIFAIRKISISRIFGGIISIIGRIIIQSIKSFSAIAKNPIIWIIGKLKRIFAINKYPFLPID